VRTVQEEGLAGTADEVVFETCVEEGRVLITLDRDFGQVPRFPPDATAGIVILELGGAVSIAALLQRLQAFLTLAAQRRITGQLWIVEPGRVRVRSGNDADG